MPSEDSPAQPGTGDPLPALPGAVALILAVRQRTVSAPAGAVAPAQLLEALALLRQIQAQLSAIEPELITAARRAGTSWQALAPALGVASRQAAERRYLRLAPGDADAATHDGRVRAVRDQRAGLRAVTRWANDNTADLRRLAGQITALTDLDATADQDVGRLHGALGDTDASALPALLADMHQHLDGHPHLAEQVQILNAQVDQVRKDTQQHRDAAARP